MSEHFDPYHQWLGISPKGQEAVYRRMVAKKPADRYASMSEFIAAVEASRWGRMPGVAAPVAVALPAPSAAAAASSPKTPYRRRRNDATAILALGAALVIVVGGLLALWLS